MTLTHWLRSVFAPRPASRPRPRSRLSVELLEDRLTPSTGGLLDPTFGSGGQVLSSFTNNVDNANALTVQADGKIVIAGGTRAANSKTESDFLVARYNADGSLDTAFGSGGFTATDFKSMTDSANAVALQPQSNAPSKILAAGRTVSGVHANVPNYDVGLARYNANGTLDTTFGTKGKVITDLGDNSDWVYGMAVDGTGRILVAGASANNAAVVRYTANGALDTSFGSGGKLITSIRVQGGADSFVLQPDGKIVLAGSTLFTQEFVVARFNANGTADTSFGSGGVVTTHVGSYDAFGGVAIQGDGKIVVSGSEDGSPSALYLLRYNANGSLDTSFGTGGLVAVPPPAGQGPQVDSQHSGVVVQSDGKIIAGGEFADATGQFINLAALRVNPDGSVDTGYGTGGWASVQFATGYVKAIALQPDGRLLLAGYARPTSTGPTDVALVRFLGSAPQIGSFTANPDPVTSGSNVTLTASNLTDGNPGSSITQVTFYYFDSNGNKATLGTATQGTNGAWSVTFTVGLPAGSYTLYAQAEDNYGAFSDPLALSLQVL